ncbi:hypothetical protein DCC39_02165 [Pueribacillus theae]|uniref:tetrahydrofolate synthase n=1 Tax=Pueribacillus theae TaxID=2171751 RepID=A0A2U1K6W2_9BACI|nr:Mur ligase family protein [Pueribacillus theae]PWA13271.1 hypothetical protein DCC39_02165 [Pueribacillus theae]
MIKTRSQAIDLVYSSYNRASQMTKRNLIRKQERSRQLLHAIGNPDAGKKIILVAGSKGKGSTAKFISSLLASLSYKVGLFTSPHQFTFNERIQLNGENIPDNAFIKIANSMYPHVQEIDRQLDANEYLGPIAINLAIALLYFEEQNVDYIVLEVGKGGLFDDTNVVDNKWAVITPIFEEHVQELGPGISNIADHKLGIIKNSSTSVIISKQRPDVRQYINKKLSSQSNEIFRYGTDFNAIISKVTINGTIFHIDTKQTAYSNLSVPLLGAFQCENIAAAIQACEIILKTAISRTMIGHWLASLQNPGRCEVILKKPVVIADAAINRDSAQYIQEVVKSFNPSCLITVLGLSEDKDYKGIIHVVKRFSNELIITKPENGYKTFREENVAKYAENLLSVEFISSIPEACKKALQTKHADFILFLGNHSFIAEAKQWFEKEALVNMA